LAQNVLRRFHLKSSQQLHVNKMVSSEDHILIKNLSNFGAQKVIGLWAKANRQTLNNCCNSAHCSDVPIVCLKRFNLSV